MQQKFAVAFSAQNWGLDALEIDCAEFGQRRLNSCYRRLLDCFIAHDSAFADQFPACLELGFDEHHDVARSALGARIGV